MQQLSFRDYIKSLASGGTIQTPQGKQLSDYSEGGLVKGKTHTQGGIPTYKMQDGGMMPQEPQQIAEVEGAGVSEDGIAVKGGERIFSIEDTQQMEQMVQGIMGTQDPNQQMQMASELGMFVAQAILKQEQINPSEQVPQEAMSEQPIMKYGGKLKQIASYLNSMEDIGYAQ